MTCSEFIDFLMTYLDGELPADQRAVFDAHLAECLECVAYLDTYRKTVALERELLGNSLDGPVPEEVPEDLVQAILAARTA